MWGVGIDDNYELFHVGERLVWRGLGALHGIAIGEFQRPSPELSGGTR